MIPNEGRTVAEVAKASEPSILFNLLDPRLPPMQSLPSRRCVPEETTSDYHRQLIDATPGDDVLRVLSEQISRLVDLARSVSTDQVDTVHPPYGWTIRQVLAHCAEAERVFGYRILRIAAGDATELADWDENAYADARYGLGNFDQLVMEISHLREANLILLKRLNPHCWDRLGSVGGHRISVRAIAWLTAGHLRHHLQIVAQRIGCC